MNLHKCINCDAYNLTSKCRVCSCKTIEVTVPKYQPEDKYGHYRREVKKESLKEAGLL